MDPFRPLKASALAIALAALSAGHASTADAQTMLTDPGEIAACLCLERDTASLGQDVQVKRSDLIGQQRTVDDARAAFERLRASADPNDPGAVDAQRQLAERWQKADETLWQAVNPAYASAVERYNGRLAIFNERCNGKFYDGIVLPRVRATLSCPMP